MNGFLNYANQTFYSRRILARANSYGCFMHPIRSSIPTSDARNNRGMSHCVLELLASILDTYWITLITLEKTHEFEYFFFSSVRSHPYFLEPEA